MAIEENNGLSEKLNPITPDLKLQEEIKRRQSKPISTVTSPTAKTYYDNVNLDIDAYQKEQKTGAGYKLTPDTFNEAKPLIDQYNQKQEVRLNDYMARNQSTSEKIGNGFVKLGGRVYTSVVGSTIGSLYGLAAWARDGEFKSFYDNEFQRSLDGVNDYLAEEFKHYYTSSKDDWEIGNFIFDKVFDGLGFATGAVLSSMIGGGATNALMKSFKLTGVLKNGTVKALKETHNLKKGMSTYSKIEGVNTALSSTAFKSSLAKLPVTASSLITGAVYESGVEARHGYSETREYLIDAYKQMHEGKTPTGEDLDEINKLAGETANGIFAANMVVVGSGNILQFGKHLGLDFKDLKKAFTPNIVKEAVDETGKKIYKSSGSKLLRGTTAVLKNPVVESQEEMIQSVISGTGKEYALAKYNNDGVAENGSLINASIKAFKKTYGSAEGWEEGLIGAIVGSAGVVMPTRITNEDGTKSMPLVGGVLKGGILESVSDWRKSETRRDEIISNLNKKGSIESLKAGIQHSIREVRAEKIKDEAVELDNELLFKNVQDDQFHSYVTSRHSAGMESSIYEDLQTLRNQPLEDFKKTFGITSEDYTEEQRSKEINSYERRARKIADTIKFIDRVYTGNNPTVREGLIYDQSMVNRIEERQTTILNEINELTGGKATSLNVRNEKGERLSKEELFKDVEKKYKAVNEKLYNQLYDDYVTLSERSEKLLDELYSELNSKEESQIEKALKEAEVKREQTAREAKQDKENKKKQKEKEVKSEKVKKEAKLKDEEAKKSAEVIQKAEEAGVSKESEDSKDDYENEIGLTPQVIDDLYDKINNVYDKENFKNLFENLKDSYPIELFPKKLRDAINKKIDQFNKEVTENNQQKKDPVNASGNTVENDITKHNKEVEANSTELNEEPFDVSKNLNKENTNKDILDDANQGKTKTTINDEEVREDGEGINYVDGRLVTAFNTVATSTRLYRQEDGKIIRLNENNTSANLDVLSSELLQRGSKLEIRLYTEPTLEIKDGEGNIIGEEVNEFGVNQIMEIVDPNNGRVIGYVHKDSYIRPDRVVETIKDTDNIALNKQLLAEFRQQVFDYHNNNNGKSYPVTIMDKSAGSIFHVSSEYNVKLTDAVQDDSRPEIVVVKPDGLYIGRVKLKDHEIGPKVNVEFKDDFYEQFKGSTMIALPTANGSYKLEFARNPKLSETSKAKEIITIAKAFVTKDFTLMASVLNDSVLDEQTLSELPANELRNIISSFIQKYTYVKNSDPTSKYRLDLQTDGSIIFRDMENTQNLILSADGTNTISNLKAFEQRINNSLLVVDLASISDNPTIIVRDSEGNSKKVKYKQFLKENLKVSFKGNNTELSNGKTEMTYVANPVIALEHDSTPRVSAVGVTPKTSPDETGGLFSQEEFLKEVNKDSTIKDKKADIERRRQEELDANSGKSNLLNTPTQDKQEALSKGQKVLDANKELVEQLEKEFTNEDETLFNELVEKLEKLIKDATKGEGSFAFSNGKVKLTIDEVRKGNVINSNYTGSREGQVGEFEIGDIIQISNGSVSIPGTVTKVSSTGRVIEVKDKDGVILVRNGVVLSSNTIQRDKEINAKYDAELKALEQQPTLNTQSDIEAKIKEVINNKNFIKLSEDGTHYINTKTGKKYKRVSNFISNDEEVDSNNSLIQSSLTIGTKVDELVRDFFADELKDLKEYNVSDIETVSKFLEQLTVIKTNFKNRDETVLANDIILYNDEIGVAGTVDLLTYDNQGNVRIYDMKTMRGDNFNQYYNGDSFNKYESTRYGKSKKEKHSEQISLYRILLNNTHGLKAKTIGVMPIEISYSPGDTTTTVLNLLKGVQLPLLDKVKTAELKALEQQSSTIETSSLKEKTNKLKKSSLGKLTNKKIRKEDAEVLPLLDVEPTEESKKREEDCKKENK